MSSRFFKRAAEQYAALRAEFEDIREGAYEHAEIECNGVLLNRLGKSLGIDPYSLFKGNEVRAHKYASDELIEYWRTHSRPTYEAYERAMFEEE